MLADETPWGADNNSRTTRYKMIDASQNKSARHHTINSYHIYPAAVFCYIMLLEMLSLIFALISAYASVFC